MNEKEELVRALEEFYRNIIDGVKPTNLLILRISKENDLSEEVLKAYINRINQKLVTENAENNWNLKERIREIVDPESLQEERYRQAVNELQSLAPDITYFETEKISTKFKLSDSQRKKLRYKADTLRQDLYQENNQKNGLDLAKRELKRIFLTDPKKIDKSMLKTIASRYGAKIAELKDYYKNNYKEWIQKRESCSTIEELLK